MQTGCRRFILSCLASCSLLAGTSTAVNSPSPRPKKPYTFARILPGKPFELKQFSILIDPKPGAGERFAAQELARYLTNVTGNVFPIVTEASPETKYFKLSVVPDHDNDTFTSYCRDGKHVVITANNQRALTFAVYDFLEKAASCRWFLPFPWAAVIHYQPALKLRCFEDHSRAAFYIRSQNYCDDWFQPRVEERLLTVADWLWKQKQNTELTLLDHCHHGYTRKLGKSFGELRGGHIDFPTCGHNLLNIIPPAKFTKTHPEYFPYDRTRKIYHTTGSVCVCTSNPAVVKEVIRWAERYFKRNPDVEYLPIGQPDGLEHWCQCDNCLAQTEHGDNAKTLTDNWVAFINHVQTELHKKFPHKNVTTLAYSYTNTPPKKQKPLPGIRFMLCHNSGLKKITENPEAQEKFRKWSELTNGNIVAYTYNYIVPQLQLSTPEIMVDEARYLHKLNLRGYYPEVWVCGLAGVGAYMHYLSYRLAWNPWEDEAALRKDYLTKLYEGASAEMTQYFQLLMTKMMDRTCQFRYIVNALDEETIGKLNALLAKARKKTVAACYPRPSLAIDHEIRFMRYLAALSRQARSVADYRCQPSEEKHQEVLRLSQIADEVTDQLLPYHFMFNQKNVQKNMTTNKLANYHKEDYEEVCRNQKITKNYDIAKTLNPWKFKLDKENNGTENKWFNPKMDKSQWDTLLAGKTWENQGYPNYDGYAWYCLDLTIKSSDKPYTLLFHAVDEQAWVYLDGTYIGGQHGEDPNILWKRPFMIQLPTGMKPGKHHLAVRVDGGIGAGGIWKPVQLLIKKD